MSVSSLGFWHCKTIAPCFSLSFASFFLPQIDVSSKQGNKQNDVNPVSSPAFWIRKNTTLPRNLWVWCSHDRYCFILSELEKRQTLFIRHLRKAFLHNSLGILDSDWSVVAFLGNFTIVHENFTFYFSCIHSSDFAHSCFLQMQLEASCITSAYSQMILDDL